MHKIVYIISVLLLTVGCKYKNPTQPFEHRIRYVEDIQFNEEFDSFEFATCKGDGYIKQYFNNSKAIEYKGGKRAIIDNFKELYKPSKSFSGLIRIRFIVNCKGESGRFRILSMNYDYKEINAPSSITNQLLQITKGLDGWSPKTYRNEAIDYYQYLSFKIMNGEIVKILP